ncbi:MAG: glycosyltransferase [Deltaproteobacteria bacterium]|nr:glycosyltransferase [Deltaproteobacteria bacterium]
MEKILPKIGIVIIGINECSHIADCIKAIRAVNYPQDLLDITYVDGGSSDNTPDLATGFEGVRVMQLNNPHPTPGRGRNAGWLTLSSPIIQFLDADMIIDPDWFLHAHKLLENNIGAVTGTLKEIYPDKNIYHILAEMEWAGKEGPCDFFGGGVLISRKALEDANGYDEYLIAGEDPDLSYRIREKGWLIKRSGHTMAMHDINMSSFLKYLKRAFRGGYAYAEISFRYIKKNEKMWFRETLRILVRSLLPLIIMLTGFISGFVFSGLIFALLFAVKPSFSIFKFKKQFNRPWKDIIIYTVNAIIIVFPQLFGVIRYYYGLISGKPLYNRLNVKKMSLT